MCIAACVPLPILPVLRGPAKNRDLHVHWRPASVVSLCRTQLVLIDDFTESTDNGKGKSNIFLNSIYMDLNFVSTLEGPDSLLQVVLYPKECRRVTSHMDRLIGS